MTMLRGALLLLAATVAPGRCLAHNPAVISTATPSAPGSIYDADKLRDPFMKTAGGGRGETVKTFTMTDFNIHNLSLRAIMKDSATAYALFTDNSFGASFILRKDKLYFDKKKPLPGVTGYINVKQKTAHLMSPDGDVQTYRLGEEIKE